MWIFQLYSTRFELVSSSPPLARSQVRVSDVLSEAEPRSAADIYFAGGLTVALLPSL